MCRFVATMKKNKTTSRILDTVCPQGIPRKYCLYLKRSIDDLMCKLKYNELYVITLVILALRMKKIR